MQLDALNEITIAEIHRRYRDGSLKAVQLVQWYLDRIEALDRAGPKINAIISLNPDILAQARACDETLARSGNLSTTRKAARRARIPAVRNSRPAVKKPPERGSPGGSNGEHAAKAVPACWASSPLDSVHTTASSRASSVPWKKLRSKASESMMPTSSPCGPNTGRQASAITLGSQV